MKRLINTVISSSKALLDALATDGPGEILQQQQVEFHGDYMCAGPVCTLCPTKKNESTISNPLSMSLEALLPGTTLACGCYVTHNSFKYCVQHATIQKLGEKMSDEKSSEEKEKRIPCKRFGCKAVVAPPAEYCNACSRELILDRGRRDDSEKPMLATSVGRKDDADKPLLAYIPKAALEAEGKAFSYGARKYASWNYRKGLAVSRTLSAALRHIFQFLDGEDFDTESGVHHLGCARANIAMALDTLENHPEMDDRYKESK